jgi:methylglutaconyl-CoA hydratase|eukprot:TRINITY_DN267_c0_g2_i1.p1 TRINITY_DN267_c0_g2~~TRINITY_DN267_c0_g2_i1.p1  ORF type:complete len:287 (+),score=132.79 TRINITY_DN267_c0_g2_i1:132-992(+)
MLAARSLMRRLSSAVTVTRTPGGQVATVTLSSPEKHNAFSDAVIVELRDAFRALAADPALRCAVLTGAGRSFSAGADLRWMKRMAAYSREENREDSEALHGMFAAVRDLPVPVVARVNGQAFGGGVGLIACCDIAVSVESAKFAFTEVRLGLLPAVISPFVVQKIGTAAASRYFLTGEAFAAPEALRVGLVSATVRDEAELDAHVAAVVAAITANSPAAVRGCKALVSHVHENGVGSTAGEQHARVKEYTMQAIVEARASQEGQEGLAAFLEKRKPAWTENAEKLG